jgi:hypothetical protein
LKRIYAKDFQRKDAKAQRRSQTFLDCGGKRSATPLLAGRFRPIEHQSHCESAVAASLCLRSPKSLRLGGFAPLR